MTLNIDDLGTVWEALFGIRSKAYNIGLTLKVPVGTLDAIKMEFSDPLNQLREILKAWLKMATQQKWQAIVDMLRSRTIDEPTLASDIEANYCRGTQDTDQFRRKQQHAIEAGQRQKQDLKVQLQSTMQPSTQPHQNPPQRETTLKKLIWQDGPKAPEAMDRGSVATDGTTVYFNGRDSTSVYQYHSDSQEWSTLPNLPHLWSTLAMADSKLTGVGGYCGGATNSLFSLTEDGRDRKWLQHFPPMSIKRYFTAAICYDRSLIVAGGQDRHNIFTTVEVLNMDTRLWSTASSLPHPFSNATTSICGERLYLLGGWDHQTGPCGTHSVLTCSIFELLHSYQTLSKSTIWQSVKDAPYKGLSCASLCEQLVVVGGKDEADKATTAIFVYNASTNTWLTMEGMKFPRPWALVASLCDNTIMVVGGSGRSGRDTVEIAKVT